ncbi:nucleotide-binding protein [Shewanella cyperi]|uniref:Nucleotide-binding protein n=1 Tax=Shewanella cyperi TaxID=2814292 RepID=A0A974XK95_9GAMM|nr:nucleotide-binding protein [Shewanella cyperi]QSX28541.1 nucleotide-binding protein [Shewanella cyperi]
MESQIKIVDKLIEEGESYTFQNFCLNTSEYRGKYGGADTPEWGTFKIRVQNIVEKLLADNSPAQSLVAEGIAARTEGNGPDQFDIAKSNLVKALKTLKDSLTDDVFGELKQEKSTSKSAALSNKVFVVHGHDQSLKTDVERFLHEVGLTPVVLHREADEGATIIEKFEKHSDVGFAFILLTPDEVSYTVDQIERPDADRNTEFRARPNVIFEFGYFVGKLGRSRVCCLHKGNVVVPSDLSGLIYKKVDNSIDPQAYAIIKELKAAGYKISM